jgi:hypothetical protein
MICPACDNNLAKHTVGELTVDICRGGCGGIWFDQLELSKVDEPHEAIGEELLDIERDPSLNVDLERRRSCPRCVGQVMMRHHFSVLRRVEVDECPGCAGLFLDTGEVRAIRGLFGAEADKDDAARVEFSEQFGAQMAAKSAESEQKTRRAQSFANMFRFILPSYYIPGKQKGGAF